VTNSGNPFSGRHVIGVPPYQPLREASMPNQLGKRFQCETCGTEVLCIKPGAGEVACCGVAMKLMQPKVLPSAD